MGKDEGRDGGKSGVNRRRRRRADARGVVWRKEGAGTHAAGREARRRLTDAAALLRGVRKRLRRSSQGVDGGASVPVTTRGRLRPEYNLSGSAPKMLPHAGAAMPSTPKRRQCTGIAAAAAVMAGHIRHGAAARQANEQADTFLLQPGCQRPCATRERLTSRHRGAAASLPESTGSAHGQAMAISGSSQRREPSSSGR